MVYMKTFHGFENKGLHWIKGRISVSVFQDDTYIEDKVTKNCGKNLLAVVLTIISWEW